MNRFAIPVVAFLILVPVLMVGLTRDPSELPSPYIGKPAPAFELPLLKRPDAVLNNASLKGQPVLVNVWATWCVGCRQEHDFLMRLSASGRIPIFGINWRDERSAALRWLSEYGDPYQASGFDVDGRAGIDWGVYGAPETFLLNANGNVVHKHLGPLDDEIWSRDFVPLLGGG